jgi:hypothetical protein
MKNVKLKAILVAGLIASTTAACVSNKTIPTTQLTDVHKSCGQLQAELTSLGVKFEDAQDDSGITGKNVGLALVFWPGIIVNEVKASKNERSIGARIDHLNSLYIEKCINT